MEIPSWKRKGVIYLNYTSIRNFEAICLFLVLGINHIVLNASDIIVTEKTSASILNVLYIFILILIIAMIILKLFQNFSEYDILDVSEYVGGKILKILIGILSIAYLLIEAGLLTSSFSQNLLLVYFSQYPVTFLLFFFLFIPAFSSIYGDRAIFKTNAILVPFAIISLLITFIAASNSFEPQRALPFLGNGFSTTFLSGASNIFAFNGLFFLFFIAPMLPHKENVEKVTFISILITGILLLLAVTALLFAFPDIYKVSRLSSVYFMILNTNFGEFIQRPEIIFIVTWMLVLISFLNIAILFTLRIFKKLTNMKKATSLSLAFIAIIFSIALIPANLFELNKWFNNFYQYASLALIFGIFISILIFANIKHKLINKGKDLLPKTSEVKHEP